MTTKITKANRLVRNAADQHLADGLTKRKRDLPTPEEKAKATARWLET